MQYKTIRLYQIMNTLETLKKRKCVRNFLPKQIPKEILERLFEAARWAPSSKNTQPWKIAVISGSRKIELMNKILKAFESGEQAKMEYDYDIDNHIDTELKERAVKCGADLYNSLKIPKVDKFRRLEQWKKNYISFNSPSVIFLFKYDSENISTFIDCGIMIQSILLAATALGLATCPQASLGHYPHIVKKELKKFDKYTLMCGISIGYENSCAAVNSYRTRREKIKDTVSFF